MTDTPKPVQLSWETLLKTAQTLLSLVVGTATVITGTGFIIVNSHLANFTKIQSYSSLPAQYLAAGIGWWVLIITLVVLLPFAFHVLGYKYYARKTGRVGIGIQLYLSNFKNPIFIGLLTIITLSASVVYGQTLYGRVDRYLGGGAPALIHLVFKEPQDISQFGFAALPGLSNVTYQLKLLSELNDGLLVYNEHDPDHAFAVIVKNELIKGVIDGNGFNGANSYIIPEVTQPSEVATAEVTAITP